MRHKSQTYQLGHHVVDHCLDDEVTDDGDEMRGIKTATTTVVMAQCDEGSSGPRLAIPTTLSEHRSAVTL
jgi:uncharacterized protein YacL (UPF0231 family)